MRVELEVRKTSRGKTIYCGMAFTNAVTNIPFCEIRTDDFTRLQKWVRNMLEDM